MRKASSLFEGYEIGHPFWYLNQIIQASSIYHVARELKSDSGKRLSEASFYYWKRSKSQCVPAKYATQLSILYPSIKKEDLCPVVFAETKTKRIDEAKKLLKTYGYEVTKINI